MIRKVNEKDNKIILDYIGDQFNKCIYLYLNYKKYGVDTPNIITWIQYDFKENITCLVLKYYNAMHIFSKNLNFKKEELLDLIEENNPSIICAEKAIIESLENNVQGYESEYGWVREIKEIKYFTYEKDVQVISPKDSDFNEIGRLLYADEDIGASYKLDELINNMIERKNQKYTRNLIIKKDNDIISHVGTGAEEEKVAMINYLITNPIYRKQGYGKIIMANICKTLLEENKRVFLINYTETSTKMYEKLGFEVSCEWGKLYKKN